MGGVALCAYGGYTLAFHKNLPGNSKYSVFFYSQELTFDQFHFKDVDAGKSVEDILAVGIVFVIVGAAIVLVTFLGCCGAISENGCILLTVCVFKLKGIFQFLKKSFCLVRYHRYNDHGCPSWCRHLWCGTERKITKNFNATCSKCMESQNSQEYH